MTDVELTPEEDKTVPAWYTSRKKEQANGNAGTQAVDSQVSEQIHAVAFAMNAGECLNCGSIGDPSRMNKPTRGTFLPSGNKKCPQCGFEISAVHMALAVKQFTQTKSHAVAAFNKWRDGLK